jgi:tetratricopeptide (TPR) repeat protein
MTRSSRGCGGRSTARSARRWRRSPGTPPQDIDDRLAHHFRQAGLADKAIAYLVRFAETARRRNALEGALRPLDQALALVDQLPTGERDRHHLGLAVKKGLILTMVKQYAALFDLLAPHRDRVDALGDPAITAPYCFQLGMSHVGRGELGRAVELARRAIQEGMRCQDRTTVGMSHFLLAWVASHLGRGFAEGAEHSRRATELLTSPEDAHYRGWSFYFLAQHLYCLGTFGPALEAAAQPEIIAEAFGAPQLRSIGSIGGMILAAMGECETAVRQCEPAIERATDALTRTVALGWLGFAHTQAGDADHAVAALQQAIDGYRAAGLRGTEARVIGILGDAYLLKGDVDRARDAARRALAYSGEAEDSWVRAWAERVLGRAAHAAGDLVAAERHLRSALEQFAALGARFEEARTAFHLAELLHALGRLEESRATLTAVREGFASLQVPIWGGRAAELARVLGFGS